MPTNRNILEAFTLGLEVEAAMPKRQFILDRIPHGSQRHEVRITTITKGHEGTQKRDHEDADPPRRRTFRFDVRLANPGFRKDRLDSPGREATEPTVLGGICVYDLNAPQGTGRNPGPRNVHLDAVLYLDIGRYRWDFTSGSAEPVTYRMLDGAYRKVLSRPAPPPVEEHPATMDDLF